MYVQTLTSKSESKFKLKCHEINENYTVTAFDNFVCNFFVFLIN